MNLVQDLDIQPASRVLLRCDLNLPQDDSGNFTDFFRLESSLPTIEYLNDLKATIFIIAHLGSPKGQKNPKFSLSKLAPIIQDQLGQKVQFVEDPFDENQDLRSERGIFLLENLRFWPEEESASLDFSKQLVNKLGAQIFIQDAFGVVHREHASLVCFPKLLPSAAGLLLQKEIQYLSSPSRSNLALIVGGAKVESKLPVISNFIGKADTILTGGVVANTFLKSTHRDIASSLYEQTCLAEAERIIQATRTSNTKIFLPQDYLTSTTPDALLAEESNQGNLQPDQLILDLGSQTITEYKNQLNGADNIIWAGTLGFAENPVFAESSKQILHYILEQKSSNPNLKIIIGGGDTVDFTRSNLAQADLNLITHLSTGGGASLLMLSGQKLPGISALEQIDIAGALEPSVSAKSQEKTAVNISSVEGSPNNKNQSESDLNTKLASHAPVLVANLKSHFNLQQARQWLSEVLESEALTSSQLSLYIAPPSLFIEELSSQISNNKEAFRQPPKIFAQNISATREGSQTGEIAASQLKDIAVGSLIGHSERRQNFNEDNQTVLKKVHQNLAADLISVLCVGSISKDPLAQSREVAQQIKSATAGVSSYQATEKMIIAYEPSFAIGTGTAPSLDYLKQQLNSIRTILNDLGFRSKVLYGGSVNSKNSRQIIDLGFDGLLVGTASLKPSSLQEIGINIIA